MEPTEGASISSAQLQAGLDQLTYLQRILYGDDGVAFTDLLSSAASASGPTPSLPVGGLSKALPALLTPLLADAESSDFEYKPYSQQPSLAKRAAFQPRGYLAMTADLMTRTSDTTGEMYQAVQLAQLLRSQADTESSKVQLRQKILQDRKSRKAILDRKQMQMDQSMKVHEDSSREREPLRDRFGSGAVCIFPGALHGQAKQVEPNLKDTMSEDDVRSYLQAWQMELSTIDAEAFNKVNISLQQTSQNHQQRLFPVMMRISQLGSAWIWLHLRALPNRDFCVRVERINILAESEIEEENSFQDFALQTSRYPLYRHITMLLQTRLMQLEIERTPAWTHLTVALFALSALCRLHEVPMQSDFAAAVDGSSMPLRGQESILHALNHLDLIPTSSTEELQSSQAAIDADKTMRSDRPASSSPASALFSDSHSQ